MDTYRTIKSRKINKNKQTYSETTHHTDRRKHRQAEQLHNDGDRKMDKHRQRQTKANRDI